MGKRGGRKKRVLNGATGSLLVAVLGVACGTATAPPPPQSAPAEKVPVAAATPVREEPSSAELPVTLTAEHIMPVIAAVAPRVKAQCWQPSLDARAADAPSNARVLVRTQIDPSGSVAAAHTEDSPPGYPQLADCVVKLVRSLTFPGAQTATAANIPFVFDTKTPSDAPAPATSDAPSR
jgi:hypothetical protein